MSTVPQPAARRWSHMPLVSIPKRMYARWRAFNRVLWWVSALALTRAILYTQNTSNSPTPRGLDLLPTWILFVFGLIWLAAALLGFVGAVLRDGLEMWGRRVLAGMFMAWGFIYFAFSFFYRDDGTFTIAALFYALLAFVTSASQPEVRYVNLVVATDAGEGRKSRNGRRLLIVDRRRRSVPVDVERRHASG